ncbi:hypothetical protein [uncultured Ruminococcus sp.]|nr:hypothetical protein [uncultured Ruminococcus sp.]
MIDKGNLKKKCFSYLSNEATTEYEFVCTGDSGENQLEIVDFWRE